MGEAPSVRTELADGIRFIRFDRPEALNALRMPDLAETARLVGDPGPDVRALVFTGTGERAFSAGMHVAEFHDLGPAGARALISDLRDLIAAVRTAPIPTAAMINGYCLGGAFELALACDLRISVDSAEFGLPEVKVGIPSVIDAALLQQHVGLSLAKELILTGDLYPAAVLERRGLLNRVVPRERLAAETAELLARVSRHSPTALASQKRLFEVWQNTSLRDGIEASVDEFATVFAAPETAEAIRRYRPGR